MLASSLAMYGAEHEAQPEAFENAFSGIWWSVSTLLTVGYGDIYPVTIAGKILAIFIAFLGVCVVAIPTGILSAGFMEKFSKSEKSDRKFHDIKEVGEILCDSANSDLIGQTIGDITEDYGVRIYLIIRKDLSIVPTEGLIVEENDIMIINTQKLVKTRKKDKRTGRKR